MTTSRPGIDPPGIGHELVLCSALCYDATLPDRPDFDILHVSNRQSSLQTTPPRCICRKKERAREPHGRRKKTSGTWVDSGVTSKSQKLGKIRVLFQCVPWDFKESLVPLIPNFLASTRSHPISHTLEMSWTDTCAIC